MVPNSEMSKQTKHNTAAAIPFKPGDFVHPRKGVAGIVGVVWQIRPTASHRSKCTFMLGLIVEFLTHMSHETCGACGPQ